MPHFLHQAPKIVKGALQLRVSCVIFHAHMAIIKSAKKNIRKSARNRVFNLRRQRAASSLVKEIRTLVSEGKADKAKELMPQAQKVLDKATKKGTIKKNTASRTKSRLSSLIKKAVK